MIFQNIEWLMWPPPLLRTAVRMFSERWRSSSQQFLDGLARQSGGRFQRFVQVGDVRVMVFVVVDFHRHFVDVRLQRIEGIPHLWKCERHSDLFYPLLVGPGMPGPYCCCSKAWASRNIVVSSKCLVKICMPTGTPRRYFRTERSCTECPPNCR